MKHALIGNWSFAFLLGFLLLVFLLITLFDEVVELPMVVLALEKDLELRHAFWTHFLLLSFNLLDLSILFLNPFIYI
jgi:hypothetical protein